jgi:MFS family permease
MMRTTELHRLPVTQRAAGQVRAGLRYIFGVPDLWITFAMLLIIGLLSYNFAVVFPLFVETGLHGSDSAFTLVYSAFSAGGLIGALLVARRSTITIRTVAVGAAALGATMLALSAVPTLAIATVIAILVGAASVAYMTATASIAQIRTEPHMIGRVLALQAVLLVGTAPISGPILGWIADTVGVRAPILIGGIAAWPRQPSGCSPHDARTRNEPHPSREPDLFGAFEACRGSEASGQALPGEQATDSKGIGDLTTPETSGNPSV